MDKKELCHEYKLRYKALLAVSRKLKCNLQDYILKKCNRIDQISTRVKSPDSFIRKAMEKEKGKYKYSNPLVDIQDQIGARIVTYYLDDVEQVTKIVHDYYEPIEEINKKPESFSEFSYVSKHFILFIPDEIIEINEKKLVPKFFELQIRTLFQHAWAEAEHDLSYKAKGYIEAEDKRNIAFSAAQAWGADRIFNELFKKYGNAK